MRRSKLKRKLLIIGLVILSILLFAPTGVVSAPVPNYEAVFTFTGSSAGDWFGGQTSAEGDYDGDGINDLLVGAMQGIYGTGKAYLFYGKPVLTNLSATDADLTITAERPGDELGRTVGFIGDVNGDGYDDFAVSAPSYDVSNPNNWVNHGRVYIFFGGPARRTGTISAATADVKINGEYNTPRWTFGADRLRCVGDVNGDGIKDFMTASPLNHPYDGRYYNDGRAYVFFGRNSWPSEISAASANIIIDAEAAFNILGSGLSTKYGDVNGDGYADILIGARGYSGETGRAYLFYGGPTLSGIRSASTANVIITGAYGGQELGVGLNLADVNGDGKDDIIVGAWDNLSSGNGRVFVFYGAPTKKSLTPPDANLTITGEKNLATGSVVLGFSVET